LSILHLGQTRYLFSEVPAQVGRGSQIDFPPDHFAEFAFNRRQSDQAHAAIRLELNQHIDVAVGSKVVPKGGAEKGQSADTMPMAELT